MANKKITDLALRSSFDDTCNIPVDDTTETTRVTGAQMNTWLRDNFQNNLKLMKNVGLSVTASAGAMTVALKQADGTSNPTSSDTLKTEIAFRSPTITSGAVVRKEFTASLSLVIVSGATLNYIAGQDARVFVYAYWDGTNKGLMVSRRLLDETQVYSLTLLDTSSDLNGLYADAARSGAAIRLIGEFQCSAIATAGTWVTPTYVALAQSETIKPVGISARYTSAASNSMASGTVIDFATKVHDTHNAVTTGAAWKFTAPEAGVYFIEAHGVTATGTVGTIGDIVGFEYALNGGSTVNFAHYVAQSTTTHLKRFQGSVALRLVAGDYIQLSAVNNTGQTYALNAGASSNYIEIAKIAEY